MKLAFVGTSHAAQHFKEAAQWRGFEVVARPGAADVVFVSEDTPTDADGTRHMTKIRSMVRFAAEDLAKGAALVLTSQVPPGFTRSLGLAGMFHQVDTLRMKDAQHRARNPEMFVIGRGSPGVPLHDAHVEYMGRFGCPVLVMSWEEAEFAKVAINCTLAAQVENTNRLARAASRCGADWGQVAAALKHDSRIGPRAYLEPGNWRASNHLLRDARTLLEIEKR